MKLMIAIPSVDYMHVETVKCLMAMVKRLNEEGVEHEVKICAGTLVYFARNNLAREAIEGGFSHVLWLDADMVFSPDVVGDLAFCGKDIVCGVFQSRRKPFHSCMFKQIMPPERWKEYPDMLFRLAGCGFGCVLMKTEALARVKAFYGDCFTPTPECGEDLAFCKRATDLGMEIWCDPKVRVGHIAHIPIYPEDYGRAVSEISNGEEIKELAGEGKA